MLGKKKVRNFFRWLFFQDLVQKFYEKQDAPPMSKSDYMYHGPQDRGVGPNPDFINHGPQDRWVSLKLYTGGEEIMETYYTFPLPIGRSTTAQGVAIDDSSVSGHHATLDFQDGILTITDAHSKNGVKIGENRLIPDIATPIEPGDVVTLGRAEMTVCDFSAGTASITFGQDPTESINQTAFMENEPFPAARGQTEKRQSGFSPGAVQRRFCSSCGAENANKTAFCTKCGQRFASGV